MVREISADQEKIGREIHPARDPKPRESMGTNFTQATEKIERPPRKNNIKLYNTGIEMLKAATLTSTITS